jgi:hypothetical protein
VGAIQKWNKCSRQPYPSYICWCYHVTEEYTWIIFVGEMAALMNMWAGSKSSRTPPILVGARSKPTNINYICQFKFKVLTNII